MTDRERWEKWYLNEYKGLDHGEKHKYCSMNAFLAAIEKETP